MKKSIESIWKEGFLNKDVLIAPQLNDLYNQKSIHFVDKYQRVFKINMKAIVGGSLLLLGITFLVGIPVMGIGFFFILNSLVIVDRKLLSELTKIDKNENSYLFLKSFEQWLKKKHAVNRRMATFYYPLFFIFIVLGFWFNTNAPFSFMNVFEAMGINNVSENITLCWMIAFPIIAILLGIFGGKLYDWDVKMVYGAMYQKLDEMIKDMETLRR